MAIKKMAAKKSAPAKKPPKPGPTPEQQRARAKFNDRMRREGAIARSIGGKVDRMTEKQDKTAAAFARANKTAAKKVVAKKVMPAKAKKGYLK